MLAISIGKSRDDAAVAHRAAPPTSASWPTGSRKPSARTARQAPVAAQRAPAGERHVAPPSGPRRAVCVNRCRPREARSIDEQREGEEQQHAGELRGRHPVEHAVPHAVDRLGVACGTRRSRPCRSRRAPPSSRARRRPRATGGRAAASRARTPPTRERPRLRAVSSVAPALLAERGAREQVDVRVEDERHHRARRRRTSGSPAARTPGPRHLAQRGLHRAREVEEPEQREADDVGGHGERQDRAPTRARACPGKRWCTTSQASPVPTTSVPGPHAERAARTVFHVSSTSCVRQRCDPDLGGGRGEGRHDGDDGHGDDRGDADRGDDPRRRRRRPRGDARPASALRGTGRLTCSRRGRRASWRRPGTRRRRRC